MWGSAIMRPTHQKQLLRHLTEARLLQYIIQNWKWGAPILLYCIVPGTTYYAKDSGCWETHLNTTLNDAYANICCTGTSHTSHAFLPSNFLNFQEKLLHFFLVKCVHAQYSGKDLVTELFIFVLYTLRHGIAVDTARLIYRGLCTYSQTSLIIRYGPNTALSSLQCSSQRTGPK